MNSGIEKWKRSVIRKNLERYRQTVEQYYIKNKRLVKWRDDQQAWSLLSPPLNSKAAHRRVHFIMKNVVDGGTFVADDGTTQWGSRTPHFMTAAVTYDCQCTCRHCSAETYKAEVQRAHSLLSREELEDAFRQVVELGCTCVVLSGGEPLLRPDVYDLIRSVNPDRSICTTFTNGEFLTDENVRRLREAGLFGVFVSLDASTAAAHDDNRGRPGLFDKAVAGLRRCQEAGLLTGLSTFITREKIASGELEAFMDLARELKVLEVFLFDVIATGCLSDQRECMLTPAEMEQISAFRVRYNQTTDYPRIIHQTMFASIAYACAAEGCPAGVAQLHLRGNGDISPCDFTPYSFGNIRNRPMKEIWLEISRHPMYRTASKYCRLSNPEYWEQLTAMPAAV